MTQSKILSGYEMRSQLCHYCHLVNIENSFFFIFLSFLILPIFLLLLGLTVCLSVSAFLHYVGCALAKKRKKEKVGSDMSLIYAPPSFLPFLLTWFSLLEEESRERQEKKRLKLEKWQQQTHILILTWFLGAGSFCLPCQIWGGETTVYRFVFRNTVLQH